MCGGGGSGGSGTQQYNWNDTLAPYWADALSWGKALTDPNGFGAYKQYNGPQTANAGQLDATSANDPTHRIADLTPQEQLAMGYTSNIANMSSNPIPAMDAARSQITNTENGNYLTGPQQDPYAEAANPYAGMNSPIFRQTIENGLNDMSAAYQNGTAADTTRMFNLAGAFGGSANQNAVGINENAFAKQMGNYAAGMQNDQYNRSAQLTDAAFQRGSTAYNNERNRQTQDIASGQNEQGLALQRANALMGVGDINRSYNQDQLNQAYTDWQAQNNHQYQMLDTLTGLLGRAQGGVSPNMSYTTPGYSASPYSQVLGTALAGYGLLHG